MDIWARCRLQGWTSGEPLTPRDCAQQITLFLCHLHAQCELQGFNLWNNFSRGFGRYLCYENDYVGSLNLDRAAWKPTLVLKSISHIPLQCKWPRPSATSAWDPGQHGTGPAPQLPRDTSQGRDPGLSEGRWAAWMAARRLGHPSSSR